MQFLTSQVWYEHNWDDGNEETDYLKEVSHDCNNNCTRSDKL